MTAPLIAPLIGRRGAIGAIGGGLALALSSTRALAAPLSAIGSPERRMRTFMLMRGALDERLVIGYLSGRYYGSVNGTLTPLFDVVAATFARYRRAPDGGYRGASVEQSFFIDRDTGEWLQTLVNPYTGKTVTVPTSRNPPTPINFGPGLELEIPKLPPGLAMSHSASPFVVDGDDVRMTEVTSAGPVGKPATYQGIVGLHARLSEINRPGVQKVRCETSYTSVTHWPAWLDMGDRPGELIATGQGVYGTTMAALPRPWVAAARRHRPELLADPVKQLEPLWLKG